jgi:hypothetical protein
MEDETKSPPPRNSLARRLGWNEWYMTGEGVAAYIVFSVIGWISSICVSVFLFGPVGVLLGQALSIFIVVPGIGFLMTWFWPPRKSKSHKW